MPRKKIIKKVIEKDVIVDKKGENESKLKKVDKVEYPKSDNEFTKVRILQRVKEKGMFKLNKYLGRYEIVISKKEYEEL